MSRDKFKIVLNALSNNTHKLTKIKYLNVNKMQE